MCGSNTGSFSPDRMRHQRRGSHNGGADHSRVETPTEADKGGYGKKRGRRVAGETSEKAQEVQAQGKLRQRQANTM